MARIPTYKKQPLSNINPTDILLGEFVTGKNQTSTYDFETLNEYFNLDTVGSKHKANQTAHGFTVDNLIGGGDSKWILADSVLVIPAVGMVVSVEDADNFTWQDLDIVSITSVNLEIGKGYYLAENGLFSELPMKNQQFLFTATQINEAVLSIGDLFVSGGFIPTPTPPDAGIFDKSFDSSFE
jgi:hypothetical protein